MLATLASAAAAPPLAPPSAADAPTLDLYVGDERRTTITTIEVFCHRVELKAQHLAWVGFFAPELLCLAQFRHQRWTCD